MTVIPPLTVRGLHNFRAVAETALDHGLRPGLLFRSAAPLSGRERIAEQVAALGVRTVLDLRDSAEQRHTPGSWQHPALRIAHVPIFDDRLHEIRFEDLAELYAIMVDHQGARLAQAFSVIAEEASQGVLVHCTAGKDRTGLLIALALEVAGVDRETVLQDYTRSQELLGEEYLAELFADRDRTRMPGIAAHRATAAPAELLAGALERIESRFGDAAGYFSAHGVLPSQLASFRSAVTTERQRQD